MSNKYEREIEEILRNMESSGSKTTTGRRFGPYRRPSPKKPRPRSFPSFNFSTSEWLLIVAVGAALLAGGYAFAAGSHPTVYTGLIAVISMICLIVLAISQFTSPTRRPIRYGNITSMTPISRNPFNWIRTQWNLFRLKMRYQRKRHD
ncbi:MAG: hypothetical protein JO202_04110 [Ktedonobacteraceae bacterium]|nr:hypothetical protein [Ktedonobacteraceae bacterium]